MAKTIKFNLICDGNSIRTIDELRNNFSIEDMLEYYKNGLLLRWLKVREYDKEYEEVKKIEEHKDMDIIKELIKIFNIDTEKEMKIEESIYILKYLNDRKNIIKEYGAQNYEIKKMVSNDIIEYQRLVDTIIDNKDDMAIVKATLNEICENYYTLFEFDYRNLFYKFYNQAPMAIFVMLSIDKMRNFYFISEEELKEYKDEGVVEYIDEVYNEELDECNNEYDEYTEEDKNNDIKQKNVQKYNKKIKYDKFIMFNLIKKMVIYKDLLVILKQNLKEFSGKTESYWKDIEPKGKKYMILRIQPGNHVRPLGEQGVDLGYSEIIDKFVIFDGIDYMSNFETDKLLYMEV